MYVRRINLSKRVLLGLREKNEERGGKTRRSRVQNVVRLTKINKTTPTISRRDKVGAIFLIHSSIPLHALGLDELL